MSSENNTGSDVNARSLAMHEKYRGKIEVVSKVALDTQDDLSLAYTPGVAEPCRKIAQNKYDVYKYTNKGNTVAIVTDGTAVLGLGDIGPEAALPVMEGKAVLFKKFAGIDAVPICLNTKDPDRIIDIVEALAPGFGGINLEDISAPRCFAIEEELKRRLDIPVFHDDQHGTAVVVLASVKNALKITGKKIENIRVVINGVGAAGIAIGKLLLTAGTGELTLCDKQGIINADSKEANPYQLMLAISGARKKREGSLADALVGADVFVGVSAPGIVSQEMIASMAKDAIVFAMANPIPEIMPDLALAAGARIVGTGRSDFPNQINNVLAFPGIFRGAFDGKAPAITEEMKIAAAEALASLVSDENLAAGMVLPGALDERVAARVARAVAENS